MTLRTLIYQAYGNGLSAAMSVSGGPGTRYTIEGRAEGNPSDREFRAMPRSPLEERFALKTHREPREIDVWAPVPAPG